jgi:hypothetical protein
MDQDLGRWLIALGGFIVLIGLVLLVGGRLGLGRLPGDLQWTRGNVRIYAPLGTCLVLSLVLTLVLNLIGRR